MLKFGLFMLMLVPAIAQPRITAILNAASGLPYEGVGTIVSIYGSGFSDKECRAETVPYPLSLCGIKVGTLPRTFVPAFWQLLYVGPNQINALISDWIANPSIVLPNGGATFEMPAQNPATGLFESLTDCAATEPDCALELRTKTRGAVTAVNGALITSKNPAHIGQPLTAWATGGAAVPVLFKGSLIPQDYHTRPTYQGKSQYPGLMQVNFVIDAGASLPCGVSVTFDAEFGFLADSDQKTNHVFLPIAISPADNPCHS